MLTKCLDITCFAVSNDMRFIVSGSNDGSIKILPFSAAIEEDSKERPQRLPFDHESSTCF